jgi:hypothetical protein
MTRGIFAITFDRNYALNMTEKQERELWNGDPRFRQEGASAEHQHLIRQSFDIEDMLVDDKELQYLVDYGVRPTILKFILT